jgi:hypothetical protein
MTLIISADSSMIIDETMIDKTPLSSSYTVFSEYHGIGGEVDSSQIIGYEKENSYFIWAMVVLVFGLIKSIEYIGFAQVDTTSDNKIFTLPTSTVIHEVKSQKLLTPKPTRIGAFLVTLVIAIILFKLINSFSHHEKLIFDLKNEYFYHQKVSNSEEVEILKSIPFHDIKALQLLTYDEEGDQFYKFELNLVLENNERINLFAVQNREEISYRSVLIAKILKKETIEHNYKD